MLTSLAFSALGLLVASRAKTMEAASGLMNLVMLPMWILVRGVFFGDAVSGRDSAGGAGAAADRGHRGDAGKYAAGNKPGPTDAQIGILLAWLVVPFASRYASFAGDRALREDDIALKRLKSTDVVVIGSGWSGLVMAKEIATRTALQVTVLERGSGAQPLSICQRHGRNQHAACGPGTKSGRTDHHS